MRLDEVKVVHYCAAVSNCITQNQIGSLLEFEFVLDYVSYRGLSHGGTLAKKLIWTERTLRCW